MTDMPGFRAAKNTKIIDFSVRSPQDYYRILMHRWGLEIGLVMGSFKKSSPTDIPRVLTEESFIEIHGMLLPQYCYSFYKSNKILSKIRDISGNEIETLVRDALRQVKNIDIPCDLPLFNNLQTLGRLLGLSDSESAVLLFVFLMNHRSLSDLSSYLDCLPSRTPSLLSRVISLVTGVDAGEIRRVLRKDSRFGRTGIIRLQYWVRDIRQEIQLSGLMQTVLCTHFDNEQDLIEKFVCAAPPCTVALSCFDFMQNEIDLLIGYLARARQEGEKGVNILFYGPSGTGKTELVKALAQQLALDLYEVAASGENNLHYNRQGEPDRVMAYHVCQELLSKNGKAMLLFDDVDEAFHAFMQPSGEYEESTNGDLSHAKQSGFNGTLDNNRVPTIWVTNDSRFAPAYLKCFDYSVRFTPLTREVRARSAQFYLSEFGFSDNFIWSITSGNRVSHVQLQKAEKVARVFGCDDVARCESVVSRVLECNSKLVKGDSVNGYRHSHY